MLPVAKMIPLPRSTRSRILQAFACALGVLLLASSSAGLRDRQNGQQSSPAIGFGVTFEEESGFQARTKTSARPMH
jgi:hypothetical protein